MTEIRLQARSRGFLPLLALLFVSLPGIAADRVGLLVSDVAPPYRTILDQIADGMAHTGAKPDRFEMNGPDSLPPAVIQWIEGSADAVPVLVCLGGGAVRAAARLLPRVKVVAAAVIEVPDEIPWGVSLIPDPAATFGYLRRFAPHVETIHVVVAGGPEREQLIRARAAVQEMGYDLAVHSAMDFREAATVYRRLLPRLGRTDSLWISSDRRVFDDDIMLPTLLKEAWARNLVLFSDSLAHVSRGVLFAPFPDNERLGETLAALVLEIQQMDTGSHRRQLLTDTHLAINTRAARHLELTLVPDLVAEVKLRFPQQ